MTSPTPFIRPEQWPGGLIGEWLLQCPSCGSHDNVEVEVKLVVRILEEGSDPVDGHHEFDGTSPAQCGACTHRDNFDAFRAFPDTTDSPGPVWFEWADAAGECGSARWRTRPAETITRVLDMMAEFWPGVTVTVEGGPDGVTVITDEQWAASAPRLIGLVFERLEIALGQPDTLC